MNVIANKARVRRLEGSPTVHQRVLLEYPTTLTERLLLMSTIILLPMQNYFSTVAGLSIMRIMFAVMALYLLLNRPRTLARTSLHPVFLAAFALLILGSLVEYSHLYSSYRQIFRIGQMFAGAIFVASLCRDQKALRAGIYGYIIVGAYVSVLLFLSIYGALHGATATTFEEASRIRNVALGDQPLQFQLNTMAFVVAQGALVALALALTAASSRRRKLFLGIALFCLVGSFLPLSRSGVVIGTVGFAFVMFKSRISFAKTILVACLIGATIAMWVPHAVWSRMTFSMESSGGRMEGRARVLTAAVEHFPEYALTGVGSGNFYGPWGMRSGFARKSGGVFGAHNIFFQMMIYWGLAGLLALLAVIWQVYHCLPKRFRDNELALCVVGIAFSLFLWSIVMHNLYAKEFSLGLGLLVGARLWIWPKGIFKPALPYRRRSRFRSGDTP